MKIKNDDYSVGIDSAKQPRLNINLGKVLESAIGTIPGVIDILRGKGKIKTALATIIKLIQGIAGRLANIAFNIKQLLDGQDDLIRMVKAIDLRIDDIEKELRKEE